MIRRGLAHHLKRHRYDVIVSYMPHMPFIEDVDGMERAVHVKPNDPRDRAGLTRLASALGAAVPSGKVSRRVRAVADARAFARFQFGTDMADLIDEVRYGGSGPQLFSRGVRTGTIVLSRGMISLTMAGGAILARKGVHRVMIEDFVPKGSVFAVGIEGCDPMVRPGDEVVVVHNDQVRAVGVARMAASAMTVMGRGVAVDVRHTM
jgi:predicted RNA-binding protein